MLATLQRQINATRSAIGEPAMEGMGMEVGFANCYESPNLTLCLETSEIVRCEHIWDLATIRRKQSESRAAFDERFKRSIASEVG